MIDLVERILYMKIIKEFVLRDIAGEAILVPTGEAAQEYNGMITMTDTAKFIWEHLEKADSLDDLVEMLTKEYEVDEETARRDAIGLITALLEHGLVECTKEDRTW